MIQILGIILDADVSTRNPVCYSLLFIDSFPACHIVIILYVNPKSFINIFDMFTD